MDHIGKILKGSEENADKNQLNATGTG